jgi:hypothetical protein
MRWIALVVTALLAVPLTGNALPSTAARSPAAQKSREQVKPRPAPKPAPRPAATPAKKKPAPKADANLGSAARVELLKKRLQDQSKAKKAPASSAGKATPKAKPKPRVRS